MKLSRQFSNALAFASGLHRGHLRKGTKIPYMAHLMAVSALVLEHDGSETEAIAALLHDVLEDRGPYFKLGAAGMRNQIRKRFGEEVLAIVEECTDTDKDPKPPWRERKEGYIRSLATVSPSGLLVSLADKVHNARSILRDLQSIGEDVWLRFSGSREDTLWYYKSVLAAFQARKESNEVLLRELEEKLAEIEGQLSSN